ncbi:Na+/H+ antiporter NhaA [Roseitranquillus sediminis]|uniref:Na+/H+ antiporter NhaA n=1 Tax=Roseitranquillus sediminis TaxID=2809051 RepID=UPI001D0CD1A1|nr:Na+/H+ antiporter NhaA [Roseitranquillus sediminis]
MNPSRRLSPHVDDARDHVLGPADAQMTLVEYGSYACPHCRAANEALAALRDRFGERMRYVFRHRPLTDNELARRSAELAERAPPERFWKIHMELMTRSSTLTEEDLAAVAAEQELDPFDAAEADRARARVEADEAGARASGVRFTPTFFINGRRYDGPWDETSLGEAMLGTLGHRVRAAALDFASWGPSAGLLLLLATLMALVLSNSPLGPGFEAFWHRELGISLGDWSFGMSLHHWVNDGLLTIFFLVVGLEIKREFTVGHLANRRSAALPIAAAIGGMVFPALLYLLIIPDGPFARGWGVPMATDTAFAIALIATMGRRVPLELRVFLTAAAIVDDIGAILVVAVFYSDGIVIGYLAAAAAIVAALGCLSRAHVYIVLPYVLVGVALWVCVFAGGLHATLAGVLLALFIPTRPPPNLRALMMQADAILIEEAKHGGEALRHGPSLPALHALDAIHDRLESPADRLLRHAGARSSYVVLPIFALANAGVVLSADVLSGNGALVLAISAGLVLGKPLGLLAASALAVRMGVAEKPGAYSWRQLAGAGSLAGIGFTMSLFIAGQAFPTETDFAAAKLAILSASVTSAVIGTLLLWSAKAPDADESPD